MISKKLAKQLGLSDKPCPVCNANLAKSGICLNACHLSPASRERFNKLMADASRKVDASRHRGGPDAT